MSDALALAIVGTGRIAGRFLPEAEECEKIAVLGSYNPHPGSAARFSERYGLKEAWEDYDTMLRAVDAVYIASPHETHFDYAKRAILAKKHVLCEKPMVTSRENAETLFRLAKENGVVLMEALKTAYCPGFLHLLQCATDGRLGQIVSVEAAFTKLVAPDSRELTGPLGGSVMELGSYPLLAVLSILGTAFREPQFLAYCGEGNCDLYTEILLRYPGAFARAKTGLGVKSEGSLVISGTKGYLRAEPPWWKTTRYQVYYEDQSQTEQYSAIFEGDGLRYELKVFCARIHGTYSGLDLEGISCGMAELMGRFRRGEGVAWI